MKTSALVKAGIVLAALFSVGCQTQPTKSEQAFGSSVRSMVEAQKVEVYPAEA